MASRKVETNLQQTVWVHTLGRLSVTLDSSSYIVHWLFCYHAFQLSHTSIDSCNKWIKTFCRIHDCILPILDHVAVFWVCIQIWRTLHPAAVGTHRHLQLALPEWALVPQQHGTALEHAHRAQHVLVPLQPVHALWYPTWHCILTQHGHHWHVARRVWRVVVDIRGRRLHEQG